MVWNFQDSYTKLPSIFYSKVNPENFNNKKSASKENCRVTTGSEGFHHPRHWSSGMILA